MNPLFLIDFYKVGHVSQYPEDTTQVWSNWTPRSTRVPGQDSVVFFGLQYFCKEILQREWDQNFFRQSLNTVLAEYRELIRATLGVENPKTDHIEALHGMGYLPIEIYALPEGVSVPLRVPALVITNTDPRFYWLPNYLETILSNILWKPCTSATTAQAYRRLFLKHARAAGETDFSFVDWQGHDFSFRGMAGREDAVLSGMAHLLSFSGTDTVPAIVAARKYYHANLTCGGSVPATEHSVMCAGGQQDELETFRHLIEDVYPAGIVSVVSDTWDLWKVLTEYIPALKDKILARDGKLVIRPDSGDPVKIMTGDDSMPEITPENRGALRLLARALGFSIRSEELAKINKGGLIYGDSVTLERADQILSRAVQQSFSPYNMVFGIGSYTYEYVTRDTYGFAMKATAVRRGSEIIDIFKKPVTDNGEKTSLKGIPAVYRNDSNGEYYVEDKNRTPEDLDNCAFRKVFSQGMLVVEDDFETIRARVRA
jgi:nicotinamide phosphoribosyltransferase